MHILGLKNTDWNFEVVQLLGLDDHITKYPLGFGVWHTASASVFLATAVAAVFFPGVALSVVGEYDEQGSNYLATRLYGATLGGIGLVDWLTPPSAYALVQYASFLRCLYFLFASVALLVSYVADEVPPQVVWAILFNCVMALVSVYFVVTLKRLNAPSRKHNYE
ncbi:uncharacterized protein LOC134188734 isoform X2 [Corticium candelabrum]|uniref:uncharacterized protein LOC134188734 isoform X2 n=1 Tax=Corticium candelabrum TaxID=121492 RepID=UPI002E275934|nr:uncharacterized protein LOC134188734 isoform X2 [Corticium candelabrum]